MNQFIEHQMKLASDPFKMIKRGYKTIELRLWDEKRQHIKIGDQICFTNAETGEVIRTTVNQLHHFRNFEELYKNLPLLLCGYTPENVKFASHTDMIRFYSEEDQKKFGVVGIEIIMR